MDLEKILSVANAISDELRIRIMSVLDAEGPRRYTEVMKSLELDVVEDSSKFAYHMGVLTEARLVEKFDDRYGLTYGGNEILSSLVRVTDSWPKLEFQDSLRRKSGASINKHIWSTSLLLVTPFNMLYSLFLINSGPRFILYTLIVSGLIFLVLGLYWRYESRAGFSDFKLEMFSEASKEMLGENRVMVMSVSTLGQTGLIGMSILQIYIARGILQVDAVSALIFIASFSSILGGIFLSWRLKSVWDAIHQHEETPDFSGQARTMYYVLMGGLLLVALWQVGYGIMNSSSGYIGGGMGLLGAFYGILKGYRQYVG